MNKQFQDRIFLLLMDDEEEIKNASKILKSPLSLAKEIVIKLFGHGFNSLKNELDEIKGFSAGITRKLYFSFLLSIFIFVSAILS
jgi:hypothetical protein